MKRKCEYITAIDRGEEPTINPYEYDEPVVVPEYPEYHRCEGLVKIQLLSLKLKEGTYTDIQNFLFDIESRFIIFADDFPDDLECIVYTSNLLPSTMKSR